MLERQRAAIADDPAPSGDDDAVGARVEVSKRNSSNVRVHSARINNGTPAHRCQSETAARKAEPPTGSGRTGNACLEWLPTAFPFAEGPRVRIRLPPPGSLRTIGSASGWPPDPQQPILIRLPARGSCGASPVGTGAASHDRKFGRSVERECLLAEFPSVLGVVRCAVEIQRGMIPISLSSIATISIFAHWPLALRAEATT
jgi:hypothetical protein